jgi:hypothetical protein
MARVFFRIVKSNPPTLEDFTSNAAKGRPIPPHLPSNLHWLWDGLSMYETETQAERAVRRNPRLGGFLVELVIPESEPFQVLRTTPSAGHFTVWGTPEELLQCVAHIRPIQKGQPHW